MLVYKHKMIVIKIGNKLFNYYKQTNSADSNDSFINNIELL